MKPQQPAREQIDDLKRQWKADPCWDIEETEGFETVREELLAYRLQMEAQWEKEYQAKLRAYQAQLRAYAVTIGLSDNLILAEYICNLESRIRHLEAVGA